MLGKPLAGLLRPGDGGRLLAFAASVGVATLAGGWRSLGALLLAVLLALLLSREAFKRLARDRSWPVLAVLAIGLGSLMGERDLVVAGLALSSEGLSLGAQMMARATAILLAVYTLTTSLSLSTIAHLFERGGFKGLGFALGIAVNALPVVQRNFQDVATALRLRGGFRRRWLQAVRLLLLTGTVNSVRHAEEIVAAAEARGFRVERSRRGLIAWQAGDSVLVAFLLAASIALLAWPCSPQPF